MSAPAPPGPVPGALYSLMAPGLVLTYPTSGIFTSAHRAIASSTAFVYYQLNTGVGLPIIPSLVIAVVIFAPLLGLLLDRLLLGRLAKAPVYARAVGPTHRRARPRATPPRTALPPTAPWSSRRRPRRSVR